MSEFSREGCSYDEQVSPVVFTYLQEVLRCHKNKSVKTFPIYVCPQKFLSVRIHCKKPENVIDEEFNKAVIILGYALKGIYKVYRGTHVFTDPQFIYRPDIEEMAVKIGILGKDRWKEIKKKKVGI